MAEKPLPVPSPEPTPPLVSSEITQPETAALVPTSWKAKAALDKKPLPLLSRRKLKAPRELAPPSQPRVKRKAPWWLLLLQRVGAYALFLGLGYGAYYHFRETQVRGVLSAPGYEVVTEVYLVRDFTDDVRTLRKEFVLAREPFQDELTSKQDSLRRARADLSGLDERRRLLQQEIESTQMEVGVIVQKAQADGLKVWETDGKKLEEDYDQRLQQFGTLIEARAKQLGLAYVKNEKVSSPEVWVNAFRLALYDPPKAVKSGDERTWAEQQLTDWRAWEKEYQDRRDQLRKRTEEIKKEVAPKIEEINARKTRLTARLAEADEEARPLQSEVERLDGEATEAQQRFDGQLQKYQEQLLQLPTRNVLEKFAVKDGANFEWRHLDRQEKYPPGSYLLWIKIKKSSEEFWTLVPFTTKLYQRTDLMISDKAFVKASSLLE